MRGFVGVAAMVAGLPAALAAQAGSPAGGVPVEVLAARRSALLDRIGDGVVVLRSAEPRSIEGDYPQDSDYREDNDFFYLTGLEAPGAWLILQARTDGQDEVRLYLPERDPAAERWTGERLGPGAEATVRTGIREVRAAARAGAEIAGLAGHAASLWMKTAPAAARACRGVPPHGDECAPALLHLPAGTGSAATKSLDPVLADLRLVKDAEELRRLRRAIELTIDAQLAGARVLEPGMWEYELEAVIEFTFRSGGAERVGFPSIIGSGPHSTTLHYDRSRRRMEAGDLVVVDVGAEWGYYSADVTRTWPVSGQFTARQRAIYDLVLGAQDAALAAVRPGATIAQLRAAAVAFMDANSGDLCGARSCARFFVHGLSHWLGMDVHDVGDYGTPLRAGMVLTVEPGIYLPEEQLGVRIEDDVLVTETGHELLSGRAPRRADEIERLMRERPSPARPLQH